MKKIVLGFFLSCLLGAYQVSAIELGTYVGTNSTLVVSGTGFTLQNTSGNIICPISGLSVENDINFVIFADSQISIRYLSSTIFICTSGTWSSLVGYTSFANRWNPTTGFYYGFTFHNPNTGSSILTSNNPGPNAFQSSYTGPFTTNVVYNMQTFLSPSIPLQCEEYLENVNTGVPFFTFEDMTSIVDLTTQGDYNFHLLEGYESFGIEFINTDNISQVGFFETQSGSLTFDSYFRKKPIVTFYSWISENSSHQPQYYFKLEGEGSIDYVEYEMLDGTYKKEENFQYGETYYLKDGFYQVQVVYNNSFFGTYTIDSFVMGIAEIIPTTKTKCLNPNTGDIYVDGVLTDYENLEDVPTDSSEFDNENTAVFSDEYLNGLDSLSNFDTLFDSMSGTSDIIGDTFKNAGTLTGTLGEYIPLVVLDSVKKTCEVFDTDGSFKYFSNGSFSFSIDIMTGTIFDNILFIPQKVLNLLTLPINNILSLVRTISVVPNGTSVCFMGYIYEIEYQSIIPDDYDDIKFFGPVGDYVIYKGEKTFFDYFVLFFFGVFFFFISIQILKPKY